MFIFRTKHKAYAQRVFEKSAFFVANTSHPESLLVEIMHRNLSRIYVLIYSRARFMETYREIPLTLFGFRVAEQRTCLLLTLKIKWANEDVSGTLRFILLSLTTAAVYVPDLMYKHVWNQDGDRCVLWAESNNSSGRRRVWHVDRW
jgi:hypothetical protein